MTKELEANTTLSHYRIVSKLGAGGMGEVYLAEDTKLDRKVAIKFLNQEFSKDEDKLNRFVREAKAASALNHPNILTVHEIGEVDGKNYIATELIDGTTLRQHLAQKEPLPLNTILKIGVQVAEALSAAHQAGIIHRDIKPENIMIRRDGYAKVLDFGLAKLAERGAVTTGSSGSEDATRIQVNTSPGVVMGTVSYMSPEQARGNPTDARTDIWSLGVVLYEMLARRVPFSGGTTSHTIVSILEKEPLALENTPAELQRIVRKTLTKDLDMRYQSARDLLIDLKNLRRDLDIQGELERSIVPNREGATGTIDDKAAQIYASGSMTRSGQSPATQLSSASSLEYAVTKAKGHKFATALVAFVLLGAIVTIGYFAFVSRSGGKNQIKSIAVMPFINEEGNSELDYLSDGMTDTLISNLSQLPNLSVKAHSSVFRYKGKETNPQTIGKELNVQAILNGRVAQRGDQLTLTLELVDTQTENVIWSDQYNRTQAQIVSLQSEIARDVSAKLRTKLSGVDEQKIAKTYTANPEAYQLYLKGLFHWNKRTPESLKSSLDYFNQAIEKDPRYAQAYAGMALAYVLLPEYSAGSPDESIPKAKAAAMKALELDETVAEAHTALAHALATYDRNLPESNREFQRAIELNANYATAHQWYGNNLVVLQRFDESIAEGKRAVELDPLSLVVNLELGANYNYSRQPDQAIAQLRKTIDLDKNWYLGHMILCQVYQAKGQLSEAVGECQRARELNDDPYVLAFLARVYAASGKTDEAIKVLGRMNEIAKQRYLPAYGFAEAYGGLGDKDRAFQWLERSLQDRAWDITYLNVDPLMDNLRSDPRFAELVRRLGV